MRDRIANTLKAYLTTNEDVLTKSEIMDIKEQIEAVEFGGSFIDEQEKMIDFFTVGKWEFLKFYSYITEDEYEATKRDVLIRADYWNAEALAEDKESSGEVIGKIIQSIMMTEWLLGKSR